MVDHSKRHNTPFEPGFAQDHAEILTETDVLINQALAERPVRQPDLVAENRVLHTLAQQLTDDPQQVLKTLVQLTRDLCQSDTAGVSSLEILPDGASVFRWVAIAGPLKYLEQTTVPGNFSPDGIAIRERRPQLAARPERYFTYLNYPQFPIIEELLFPVSINQQPLGTLWVLSHTEQRRFDAEDQRLMTSLAGFTAVILQNLRNKHNDRQAELNAEFLANVSQDLAGATSVNEIVQKVGRHLNQYLNASVCAFVEIGETGDEAVINYDWHQENEPSLIGVYSLPDLVSAEFLQAAKAGQTTVVHDIATDPRITNAELFSTLQIGSFINIPFIRENEWKFTLGVCHQAPYYWHADRIELMRELSARIWIGVERIRAEDAQRQSESRLRLMIESAKEYAIFTLDLDGIISSWNSGAERLLGYSEAEALGRHGRMIFEQNDRENGRAEWEMNLTLTQGRAENERWHVRRDGSRFWASGLMMPLQDETGDVQGFVKILQDRTIQRQANERFHLLYDTTSDLLATEQPLELMHNLFSKLSAPLDLQCYYHFMLEEHDNRLMLHLKNHEGISEETASTIEWVELGQYLCGIVAQTQQQLVLNQAQIAAHPNAKLIASLGITAYACQPLVTQGRFLGSLSFGSFTRTQFTPEEIDLLQSTCDQIAIAIDRADLIASIQKQTEQLQQINRIKDEFLAVLSHELRSPLNPILGWSRLLQHGKLDQAKTAQALATIERNAKLQSQLIEDLLDVSRILRGKLNLDIKPVNLAATLRSAVETVQLAAEAKAIQIEFNFDSTVTLVSGDSTRLQQVVWNLLSNAVKFTPTGGRVSVTLDQVEEEPEPVGEHEMNRAPIYTRSSVGDARHAYTRLTVRDNGKGIPAEFLPHVFDYFRQADSTTTRSFGGLGLGLAIVRHLVELHGGTVYAESPGRNLGTTITVKIPLMPMPLTKRQVEYLSPAAVDLRGVQVLLVDDDADSRELVVFILEQIEATVIAAASAEEALQVLMQSKPDILLSNIRMAELGGYPLLRQVRALPPEQGGTIPAIALTPYTGDIDRQQVLNAGFQSHLAKPLEPTELISIIATLTGISRYH